MNASSTEQSRGPKVWSAIYDNIPEDSINKNKHHRSAGQKKVLKYLRESSYHRIKCSLVNSLAALMRK